MTPEDPNLPSLLSEVAPRLNARIDTPRLSLEPMVQSHADAFFGQMQEAPLYEWISMDKPQSLESLRERWKNIANPLSPDGHFAWPTWAVRRTEDGWYIGRVDAEIDGSLEAVNFGYYFFHPFCGQGYATEAVIAASQHLIDQGVQPLVATVTVGNVASARVLQKAGYVLQRTLVGNDIIRGVVMDDWEYVKAT